MPHTTTPLSRMPIRQALRLILLGGSLACASMLAGCARPQSSADMERQQACSQRADQQFDKQNRYLMSERDQTDTPFSSSGMPGDPTRGLNNLYQRDRLVDDCLHTDDQPEPAIVPAAGQAH